MLPFNDVEAFERTVRAKADTLAAVIMEPVNFDSCGLIPTPEFLRTVRELTRELGIVLIFDEVLSGFRVRPGAILGDACIPDMTVLGKAVGGGMPISAFMGRREIMETCTPVGPALHSGTYNAPPVLVSAIGAFLDEVAQPGFYVHCWPMGNDCTTACARSWNGAGSGPGCRAWARALGCSLAWTRSRATTATSPGRIWTRCAVSIWRACERGVYLHYVSPHHGYSSAHTLADIDETLTIFDDRPAR